MINISQTWTKLTSKEIFVDCTAATTGELFQRQPPRRSRRKQIEAANVEKNSACRLLQKSLETNCCIQDLCSQPSMADRSTLNTKDIEYYKATVLSFYFASSLSNRKIRVRYRLIKINFLKLRPVEQLLFPVCVILGH